MWHKRLSLGSRFFCAAKGTRSVGGVSDDWAEARRAVKQMRPLQNVPQGKRHKRGVKNFFHKNAIIIIFFVYLYGFMRTVRNVISQQR